MPAPLKFEYDFDADVLTVEGVKYAGDLFRRFGVMPIGTKVEVVAREDGVITLRDLRAPFWRSASPE